MYARVARWDGADADAMRRTAEQINSEASAGPPEGLAISLFETEDDLRAGDALLNEMSPPDDGFGSRTSVENFEVAVDVRL